MSKFNISKNANLNYLIKIVKLGEPLKHPNADKLHGFKINSNLCYTDLSYKESDICVYFECGIKIDSRILYTLNLYEDKLRNKNQNERGYFGKNGLVRQVRLRGEQTSGFLLKLDVFIYALSEVIGKKVYYKLDEILNNEFDSYGDYIFVTKYVPKHIKQEGKPKTREEKRQKKVEKFDRVIKQQFNFHIDTLHINRNPLYVSKGDLISCTYKIHGTSFIVANVLVKKPLTLFDKIIKLFNKYVQEEVYDFLYASRNVIKNQYLNKNNNHYYGENLWKIAHDHLSPYIPKGYTVYGEMAGYTPTGALIQKGYDYGCVSPNETGTYIEGVHYKLFIYRITKTNVDGQKIELTWGQIKDFCNFYNLRHVPEFYYGIVDHYDNKITDLPHGIFQDKFVDLLKENYLEKLCFMSTNKVPAEGVVIRKDNLYSFLAYKFISNLFKEGESKNIENGELDIETQQSLEDDSEN